MKKVNKKLLTILMMSGLAHAGGTFVEPVYESEDVIIAEEAVIEEAVVEDVTPIAPAPIPVPVTPVVKAVPEPTPPPIPLPLPVKDIYANGLYAGIGISTARFETSCKGTCVGAGTDKTAGLMARVGYDMNQYVGIEARGIRTNWKADGGKVKHIGIFVKPMLPIGDSTNIYGLAGLAKTTTQGKLQRVDSKSFAWGAGVEYDVSEDHAKDGRYNRVFDGHGDQESGLGVFADYERLIQKSGSPDLDTVNVGVTYDF